jgi:hypothetical protein
MLLADSTATTLFLMGLMVVVVVVLRNFRSGTKKFSARSHQHSTHAPTPGHHLAPPPQLSRWEVQMHEMARDLSGQLDSKIAILEHLVRDAQHQADRLEAVIERARHLQLLGPEETGRAAHFDRADERRLDGRPRYEDDELNWLARGSGRVTPPLDTMPGEVTHQDDRYRQIYRLAASGYSSAAIAHKIGTPIGEVELILSLRGKA